MLDKSDRVVPPKPIELPPPPPDRGSRKVSADIVDQKIARFSRELDERFAEMHMYLSDKEPRALTSEELRDQLLDRMHEIARYWSAVEIKEPDRNTILGRIDGALHSVLSMLDGCSSLPAFDLVAKPHPEDKQYNIDEDENWIEDETRISDMLHEHWYRKKTS